MVSPARTIALALSATALLAGGCGGDGDGGSSGSWRLVWSDEFDGPSGTAPDPAHWSLETGGHGWGNQELQYYTDRPDNVATDGNGHLVITARRESFQVRDYTSARLTTRGKAERTYGRFEARLKLPTGRGMWPAFWMLGSNVGDAGWPGCGEIDIVEARGAQPWRVSGALHGPGYSGGNAVIAGHQTADRADLTADFHLFAVEWDPGEIRFYVDGEQYHQARPGRLPTGGSWVFDQPFFLILNVAVGGNFGGPPDDSTVFPQTMLADYVRVYQRPAP